MNLPRHVETLECPLCGAVLRRDRYGENLIYTHDVPYGSCSNDGKKYRVLHMPVVEVEELQELKPE
jgi:hypothetical protein